MSEYIYYGYLIGSVLTVIAMLRASVSFGKIINSLFLFLFAYYILNNYLVSYLLIGAFVAFIIAIIVSFSETFRSKSNIFHDVKDVAVSIFAISLSLIFWMQIICINLYIDASKIELE